MLWYEYKSVSDGMSLYVTVMIDPHGCTNPTGSTILVPLKDGKFMKVLRCAFFAQQFYVQKIRLQLSDVKESHGDCLAERAAIGCTGAAWH